MAWSRRAVLLAAASGALAGCGRRRTAAATPPSAGPSSPPSLLSPSSPSPALPASPSPSTLPTRDEIVARHRGATPTRWGLTVPGVTRRLPGDEPVVALTFDACGGPYGTGYDRALIALLRKRRTPATLFLNARWIDANPGAAAELAADPLFEIAHHGTRHLPLSVTGRAAYGIPGTRGPGEAYDEVIGNLDRLRRLTDGTPRWFRTGTAHYDEVAARIVADLGFRIAGFDVNGDAGATHTPEQVARAVLSARPGSIVIAHLNRPHGGTAEGFAAALPRLLDSGLRCVRLSDHLA